MDYAAAAREPVFIAPAGIYGHDAQSSSVVLASADATVHYEGEGADPVEDRRTRTVPIRITFLNGSGAGMFRAGYTLRAQEVDFSTGSHAEIALGGSRAATTTQNLFAKGYLQAQRFTFGEELLLDLTVGATASAGTRAAAIDIAAHVELTSLLGYDGAQDRLYPLSYRWEPVEEEVDSTCTG